MNDFINRFVDQSSHFLAKRPGLLPMVGLLLVILNFLLHIFLPSSTSWFVAQDPLLHIGLIAAILGILIIKPLG